MNDKDREIVRQEKLLAENVQTIIELKQTIEKLKSQRFWLTVTIVALAGSLIIAVVQ